MKLMMNVILEASFMCDSLFLSLTMCLFGTIKKFKYKENIETDVNNTAVKDKLDETFGNVT